MDLSTHPGWQEIGLRRGIGAAVFMLVLLAGSLGASLFAYRYTAQREFLTGVAIAGATTCAVRAMGRVFGRLWPELATKRPKAGED